MSKRAEQAALEAYPPTHPEGKRHAKRVQSESVDTHKSVRTIFHKGYEKAEKDMKERFIRFVHEHYPINYTGWVQDFQKAIEDEK